MGKFLGLVGIVFFVAVIIRQIGTIFTLISVPPKNKEARNCIEIKHNCKGSIYISTGPKGEIVVTCDEDSTGGER